MKRALSVLWRWSWLVTIPVTAILLFWAVATLEHFHQFGLRYETEPVKVSLQQSGWIQLRELQRSLDSLLTPFDPTSPAEPLRTINLFVPETGLSQLDQNLPHSGREDVEGGLWNGDHLQKVKVRYRGDFAYHWAFPKKSLRVKTKRTELFEGMRKLNLLAPKRLEQVNGYLSYWLAQRMGLIAPKAEFVALTLNGKWRGLYLLLEQLDESTLRRHRRMPGDIYAGELLAKDAYAGINDAELFRYASLWDKVAINNHYAEASTEPLKELMRRISPKAKGFPQGLSELLDMKAWGNFFAFQTICQSRHYDRNHNWRLYFDPATSKFVPVVWDSMGFNAGFVDNVIINNQLHYALLRNSDFLLAKQQALLNFFDRGMDRELLAEFDRITAVTAPYIAADRRIVVGRDKLIKASDIQRSSRNQSTPWPGGSPFRIASSDEIFRAQTELKHIIADNFRHLRNTLNLEQSGAVYSVEDNRLKISFSGNRAIEKLSLRLTDEAANAISGTARYWDTASGPPRIVDISPALSTQGSLLNINATLLNNYIVRPAIPASPEPLYPKGIRPAYFEFDFQGLSPDAKILGVDASLQSSIPVTLNAVDQIAVSAFESLDRPIIVQPQQPITVWNGTIQIEGATEIEQDLLIEPGATILLAPGASLLLKGKLLARGTKQQPIQFKAPTAQQQPWGAVVLQGSAASGSELSHCDFQGGSGFKGDLFEYSGMFSIHDASGIIINNCRFSNSKLVDDMVHVVYSDVSFNHCEFSQSLSDALDIDISTATINNCRFQQSGNDAIDLMGSDLTLSNTFIRFSGDKGISVGEGSRLLGANCRLERNQIAIQSKDDSIATLLNVDFTENEQALDAYQKNWRYGNGGRIYVYNGRFNSNALPLKADKKSYIHVSDSYFDTLPTSSKRLRVSSDCDSINRDKAQNNTLFRNQQEAEAMTALQNQQLLNSITPTRRGMSAQTLN